jgi:hypothetical protein
MDCMKLLVSYIDEDIYYSGHEGIDALAISVFLIKKEKNERKLDYSICWVSPMEVMSC